MRLILRCPGLTVPAFVGGLARDEWGCTVLTPPCQTFWTREMPPHFVSLFGNRFFNWTHQLWRWLDIACWKPSMHPSGKSLKCLGIVCDDDPTVCTYMSHGKRPWQHCIFISPRRGKDDCTSRDIREHQNEAKTDLSCVGSIIPFRDWSANNIEHIETALPDCRLEPTKIQVMHYCPVSHVRPSNASVTLSQSTLPSIDSCKTVYEESDDIVPVTASSSRSHAETIEQPFANS